MIEGEAVYIATLAFENNYTYDRLKDSDHLFGKQEHTDRIWGMVENIKKIGLDLFKKENSKYDIYFY